jgi:hypothetical protein
MSSLYTAIPVFTEADLRFGVWDGLTPPVAYSDIISFETVEISPTGQEVANLIARNGLQLGVVLDSQQRPTDKAAAVKLLAATMTPKMLALALGASSVTEVTQGAAAVADEPITLVMGQWTKLANSDIAAESVGTPIVLETTDATPVAITATKFEIDHDAGLIRPLHADAVGAKTLSYWKAARVWDEYAAGGAVSEYVHITGTAVERRTGFRAPLDIWRTRMAASGTFDPAAGKHLKVELSGDLIQPSVAVFGVIPTAPWRFRLRTS